MKKFLGYIVDKGIKSIPRKKKVSPTIKSVKPTKDISGSVKRVTRDVTSKRIDDVNKVRDKMSTGKKMMREAQKERKNLVDTGRAFKFRGGKEVYSIRPGENPKVKFKDTIAKDAGRTPTKKFKKGKELREKKMGGGMMGRRMGYSDGSGLKDIPPGKKFKGLRMLPKEVRNKMKYKKDGGKI